MLWITVRVMARTCGYGYFLGGGGCMCPEGRCTSGKSAANVLRFWNIRSVVAVMHDVFHGYDAATLIYTRLNRPAVFVPRAGGNRRQMSPVIPSSSVRHLPRIYSDLSLPCGLVAFTLYRCTVWKTLTQDSSNHFSNISTDCFFRLMLTLTDLYTAVKSALLSSRDH